MGKIIMSPEYVELNRNEPLIFLAGPIQGARDWQGAATEILKKYSVTVASPRRRNVLPEKFTFAMKEGQRDWEHFYLDRAAEYGAIVFWLAKESKHVCTRAYAQTTRFELAEFMTIHRLLGARVVVGIESGFSGAEYIRATLKKKASFIPIFNSLNEVCVYTAEIVCKKPSKVKLPYRRICRIDAKEIAPWDKLVPLVGNRFKIDRQKRTVGGLCQGHAKMGKEIAKRNLRRTLEKN